jgi:hypothetical protein
MNINKDFSKGGLIGSLLGALVSTQVSKPDDSMVKKTAKTGLLAALGFALGSFVENRLKRK